MRRIVVTVLAFITGYIGWVGAQKKLQDRTVWYEVSNPIEQSGEYLSMIAAGSGLWRNWQRTYFVSRGLWVRVLLALLILSSTSLGLGVFAFESQLFVQRLRHRRRTSIALIVLISTTPPMMQVILHPTVRISSRDALNEHSTFGGYNATLHTSSMPISLHRIGRRRKWREAGN